MIYLPAILTSFVVLVIFTRPFTVLFHELGHALSALLLTGKGSTVFIGSYGEKEQSLRVKVGSLEFWFRYNPLQWKGGLCEWKETDIKLSHEIISILSGPLFSMLLVAILTYLGFYFDSHGALKLILVFMLVSTVMDLFGNLIPQQFSLPDGSTLYSDGYLLINVYKRRRLKATIKEAIDLFNEKQYGKAFLLFEHVLENGIEHQEIYRFAYTAGLLNKEYEKAVGLLKIVEERYTLTANDCYNYYFVYVKMQNHWKGQEYLDRSLLLEPNHSYALNAMGYHLNKEGRFEEAISFLNKAVEVDQQLAYAYNNRGHAYIELAQLERGLSDIQYSLELDSENAYAYRNLGIYYLKIGQFQAARQQLLKAKEIDGTTEMIEELLLQTEKETSAP